MHQLGRRGKGGNANVYGLCVVRVNNPRSMLHARVQINHDNDNDNDNKPHLHRCLYCRENRYSMSLIFAQSHAVRCP